MTRLLVLLACMLLPLSLQARLAGPPLTGHEQRPVRDLAEVRKSGELRVLVNQSRNSSGEVKGQIIGVEYHRIRAFERYLNSNARDGRTLRLKIIPRSKDQLLGALQRGEGDLVAPGELLDTRTAQAISASAAIRNDVPLVFIARKGNRRYQSFEQLAGRTLVLPAGSAVGEALEQFNQQLALRKRPAINIEWADSSLATEDVLEMVQAGIYPFTVVELPIAERWAKVMPKLRVDHDMVLAQENDMSWFVRRDAPMLRASIDRFLAGYRSPDDLDSTFQRVYRRLYKVHYPLKPGDVQRLERVRPVLQKHADEQGFDWLALAAMAFKESTLNPAARGSGGATGLMQITPAAARSVGVSNIQGVEGNVQASARYLAMIRRKFFASKQLNERERLAFVLAAYNMGPERVQGLRAEARRRGLNPNQWFFQVERVAMEQVGMGVVSYVNSVNKYYVAYDREREQLEAQKRAVSTRR